MHEGGITYVARVLSLLALPSGDALAGVVGRCHLELGLGDGVTLLCRSDAELIEGLWDVGLVCLVEVVHRRLHVGSVMGRQNLRSVVVRLLLRSNGGAGAVDATAGCEIVADSRQLVRLDAVVGGKARLWHACRVLFVHQCNFGPVSFFEQQQILSKMACLVVNDAFLARLDLEWLRRWHSFALIVEVNDAGLHLIHLVLIYHAEQWARKYELVFGFRFL